jgi:hypothetical protein
MSLVTQIWNHAIQAKQVPRVSVEGNWICKNVNDNNNDA